MNRISFFDATHKRSFVRNYKRIAKNIISETSASIVLPIDAIEDWKMFQETTSGIYQIQEV